MIKIIDLTHRRECIMKEYGVLDKQSAIQLPQ